MKTEEEAIQALVPEEWSHLHLTPRSLCGKSAQEKVTHLSLTCKEAFWSSVWSPFPIIDPQPLLPFFWPLPSAFSQPVILHLFQSHYLLVMFSDLASVTPDSLSLPYQRSHRLGCFRTSLHIWKALELLCLILSLPERRPSALSEDTVLPWRPSPQLVTFLILFPYCVCFLRLHS